jgi:hypothetical protein
MIRTVRMVPFLAVAAGAVLLLLGMAVALAWRGSVTLGPAPGAGPAAHRAASIALSGHSAVLTAAVRQDDRGDGKGGSDGTGGGNGQGGNGQGSGGPRPGEGTATPELPSAFLLLLGLIPLAVTGVLLRRRRRGGPDAG